MALYQFRRSPKTLQEEFQNLDMASCFSQVFAPGVHAMAANQVSPTGLVGMVLKVLINLNDQRGDVLGVVENRNPDTRLVGGNPLETFEHFKVADADSTDRREVLREQSAPDAVCMEDRSGTSASSKAVEQSLCTALGLVLECRFSVGITNHKVVGPQMPFVFTAGCDQKFQGFTFDDRRVIARSAQRPAAVPELVTGSPEPIDGRLVGLQLRLDRFKLAHSLDE